MPSQRINALGIVYSVLHLCNFSCSVAKRGDFDWNMTAHYFWEILAIFPIKERPRKRQKLKCEASLADWFISGM